MSIYSFETLAIHEQPKPLESITSWLRRNATLNYTASVDALTALCFPM
jgi:hypothetical protein